MDPVTRRRAAAALLTGFLPLAVAWALIWPANPDDTTRAFANASAHHGAWELAASLFVVSFAVCVPGLVSLVGRVSGRGARLTAVGALLAAAGFVCNMIAGTFSVFMSAMATDPDRPAMLRAWNALDSLPVPVVVAVLVVLGHLGLILAAFGLLRARLVGWWVPVTTLAGVLGESAVGPADHWVEVGVAALVGVALVGVARALWAAPAAAPAVVPAPAAVSVSS